jgi:hypothetical protein
MSDGYEVYAGIAEGNGLAHLACWAHCRRYFVEAEAVIPKTARSPELPATQFIAAIADLYAVEARARELTPEQRHALRQEHSRLILQKIEAMLLKHLHAVVPGSLLGKALHYLSAQWPKLIRYADNGLWPIDNNLCENAIRPFVTGRSLCTSFRNVGKHWELSLNIVTTRTMFPRQRSRNRVAAQIAYANLPWGIRHHLLGRQNPVVDQAPNHMIGDVKHFRRLGHRQPVPILLR